MPARSLRRPLALFLLGAAAVYAASLCIVRSPAFAQAPAVAWGVTGDLTLVLPLLWFFLGVRRARFPAITVLPVFLLSLALAAQVLPQGHRDGLRAVELLAAPAEIVLIATLARRARRLARAYRIANAEDLSFPDAFRRAAIESFGDFAATRALALEVSMLYCAFLAWRKAPRAPAGARAFSYHRGWGSILAAFAMAIAVESLAVHFLVQRWSPTAAWVLTGTSLYSLVWLAGDYRAMVLRPILLRGGVLEVRIGLRWQMRIPLSCVRTAGEYPRGQRPPETLQAVVFGEPRLLLELDGPVEAEGPFGIRRRAARVALTVDEPERFLRELEAARVRGCEEAVRVRKEGDFSST